jgi:putative radical SAM enzyme (TIGR03279 family)
MKKEEIDRVIRYRMTPVNVSVHTTDPELRIKMLGNRFAGDVLDKIKQLIDGGITVNAQIVLCKGLNDGPQLDRTIAELSALYPGVASISAVPVGLTKWREGLFELEPFTSDDAAEVIKQVSIHQKRLLEEHDTRLIYLADEFYIKAGIKLPSYDEYEDFPQIENGVGLMSLLSYEFDEYLRRHAVKLGRQWPSHAPRTVSIATGKCAADHIKEMAQTLEKRYNGLRISVYAIENEFFGENVTVTGLLTGQDIYGQLKGRELGSELLISRSMLKSGEELFLDDYTVEGLISSLSVKVTIVENDGADLIRKIMSIK